MTDLRLNRRPLAVNPPPDSRSEPAAAQKRAVALVSTTDGFESAPSRPRHGRRAAHEGKLAGRIQTLLRQIFTPPEIPKAFLGVCESARKHHALAPNVAPAYPLLGLFHLFGRPLAARIDMAAVHAHGNKVVAWTVNQPGRMRALLREGIDGLITDRPDLLREALEAHDPNGDGVAGDLVGPDGLVDARRFQVQGHRGARGLRPENSLPAIEAGLDWLCNTLEVDLAVTADGVPVVWHDTHLEPAKGRRLDGKPFEEAPLLHALTVGDLQQTYAVDKCLRRFPAQQNDPKLSPASCAFAASHGMRHPYTMATLDQLLDFTRFYADYYRSGPGRTHPDAERRAKNAEKVRFNLEFKVSRETEESGETPAPETFARATDAIVRAKGMEGRTTVQCFDPRALEAMHRQDPAVATNLLVRS